MNIERLKNAKYKAIENVQKLDDLLILFEKDAKDAIAYIINDELTDELLDNVINDAIAEDSCADKLSITMRFIIKIHSYELHYLVDVNHTRIKNTYKTYDKSEYNEIQALQTLFRYRDRLKNANKFTKLGFYDFDYIGYDKIMDDYIEPMLQSRLSDYGAKVLDIKGDSIHTYDVRIIIENPV